MRASWPIGPRHPVGEPPLSGLLERSGPGRFKESRFAVAHAPTPAQSKAGTGGETRCLSGSVSGATTDLPVQTEALLSAAEEAVQPEKVRPTGAALSKGCACTAGRRLGFAG